MMRARFLRGIVFSNALIWSGLRAAGFLNPQQSNQQ